MLKSFASELREGCSEPVNECVGMPSLFDIGIRNMNLIYQNRLALCLIHLKILASSLSAAASIAF